MKDNVLKFIAMILYTGLIFGAGFWAGCRGREIKMSPLEKQVDKYPELAAYAACVRGHNVKGSNAGQNLDACVKPLEFFLRTYEHEKCKRDLGGLIIDGKKYKPEQVQDILNIQAHCYLTIYNRYDKLKAELFDQMKLCKKQ